MEVGRSWRCLVLLQVTNISSFLMSLSLSMFAVAQALTRSSSDILSYVLDVLVFTKGALAVKRCNT